MTTLTIHSPHRDPREMDDDDSFDPDVTVLRLFFGCAPDTDRKSGNASTLDYRFMRERKEQNEGDLNDD